MSRLAAVEDHALALVAVTQASLVLLASGRRGAARRVARAAEAPARPGRGTADAWRCTRAVSRAAAVVPWRVRCLPAALALHRLLAWRGSASKVCLGVRAEGDDLVAHAWVECGGLVLDPLSPAEPYEPLPLGGLLPVGADRPGGAAPGGAPDSGGGGA